MEPMTNTGAPGRSGERGSHRRVLQIPWLSRGRSALVSALLVAGIIGAGVAVAGSQSIGATIGWGALGLLIGYQVHVHRPGSPLWQVVVTLGLVGGLAALGCIALAGSEVWLVPLVLLPASDIGAWLGQVRERITGPKHRVIAHDWAGVQTVGGARQFSFTIEPLTRRVHRAERRAFARAHPGLSDRARRARLIAISIAAWVMPVGLLAMGVGVVQEVREAKSDMPQQLLGMSAVISLMLLGGLVLIWFSVRARGGITSTAEHLRLSQFAQANGFAYTADTQRSLGREVTWTRAMWIHPSKRFIIANREFADRQASRGNTTFGGVCELVIGVQLPHILLRSRDHRAPAFASATAPARSQILALEGDFDRHFELYCPEGYERDALYLFTPDVMAALIDEVHGFDVELRDDRIVLTSRRDLVTVNPADWDRLARALDAIAPRIGQWRRWRDDRHELTTEVPEGAPLLSSAASASEVAAGGRRLREGIGAGLVLAVTFGVVYLTLTLLATTT